MTARFHAFQKSDSDFNFLRWEQLQDLNSGNGKKAVENLCNRYPNDPKFGCFCNEVQVYSPIFIEKRKINQVSWPARWFEHYVRKLPGINLFKQLDSSTNFSNFAGVSSQ